MSDQTTQFTLTSPSRRFGKTAVVLTIVGSAVLGILVALFAVLLVNSDSQVSSLRAELSHSQSEQSQVSSLKTQLSQLQSEQAALSKAQQTAQSANLARLGVCWQVNYQTSGNTTWVSGAEVDQPVITNGVYTCPNGDSFISVVPASQGQNG